MTPVYIVYFIYYLLQLTAGGGSAILFHASKWREQNYLNAKRPLWVLEDHVRKQDEVDYAMRDYLPPTSGETAVTVFLRTREESWPTERPRQQYPATSKKNRTSDVSQRRRIHSSIHASSYSVDDSDGSLVSIPTFDGTPGADSEAPPPIFIYNRPKGELILNTMLSAQRYPMQEPIPGQLLRPPKAPLFRAKPVRVTTGPHNLTLIPFYAHEAVNGPTPHFQPRLTLSGYPSSTAATTPMQIGGGIFRPTVNPQVVYETQVNPTSGRLRSRRLRRRKKSKQYEAYHSPDEVRWMPEVPTTMRHDKPTSLAVNHRQDIAKPPKLNSLSPNESSNELKLSDDAATTEAVSYSEERNLATDTGTVTDNRDFQIVYISNSLEQSAEEPPEETATVTTTEQSTAPILDTPRLSSRYSLEKQYYAFPVFTLSKLMQSTVQPIDALQPVTPNPAAQPATVTPSLDTWFILNSRYKGPYKSADSTKSDNGNSTPKQQTKTYFTSKYIYNTSAK